MSVITAKDNPKIKKVTALVNSAKRRKESGVFVLEGVRLCSEALRETLKVKELYYTNSAEQSNKNLILKLMQKAEYYSEVSNEVFLKMSDTSSPQGILLTVEKFSPQIDMQSGRWLAFERIADPSNLGAAARTAEALGFSGIILSKSGVDPFSPKSLRASMGALLRLPVIVCENFSQTLTQMKTNGFTLSGTVVNSDAQKINEINFSEKEVAVIGNEANGLTDEIKAVCDRLVTIPMSGRAESLNAATAAAVVMWEMVR